MREIKFRVWDPIERVMSGVISLKALMTPHPQLNEGNTWLQFTGFYTKQGDDLYEGDILERDTEWYEVMWDQDLGQWLAKGICGNEDDIALGEIADDRDLCLCGNIYENPEFVDSGSPKKKTA